MLGFDHLGAFLFLVVKQRSKDRGFSLFTSDFLPTTLVAVCCEGTLSFVVVLCYRRLEVDA